MAKHAATEPGKKPSPLISDDTLRSLYARTALCASRSPGHAANTPPRAALLAALTLDLRAADIVIAAPSDRVLEVLAPAKRAARQQQRKHSDGPRPQPVPQLKSEADHGARLTLAADTAFHLRQGDGNLVLVFAEASAASTTTARVAFGFAGAAHLPVLFALETRIASAANDGNPADALGPLVEGLGFPAITVEGSDAVALYRVAFESMKRARAGGGPTLIDARFVAAHPSSGREPLMQLEKHLAARGIQPAPRRS